MYRSRCIREKHTRANITRGGRRENRGLIGSKSPYCLYSQYYVIAPSKGLYLMKYRGILRCSAMVYRFNVHGKNTV